MTRYPLGRIHNLRIFFFSLGVDFARFFSGLTPVLASAIESMRFGTDGASVRAVLPLAGEHDFRATIQAEPPRVVIDLPAIGSRPAIKRSDLPFLIKDVRMEPVGNSHTRLSFLLDNFAVIRSAFLMP